MATEKMDPSGSAPDAIPKFRWSPQFARRSVSQEDANGTKELYPGCNAADWLRSCSEEGVSPVEGVSSETSNMFAKATIVGKVPARWSFHPGCMHTFGITENYFVIVELPLSISVPAVVKRLITNSPLPATFRWYPEEQTQFYLLCRKTGQVAHQFMADAFCYFHIINSYEEGDCVVVDICCYRDSCILDNMWKHSS